MRERGWLRGLRVRVCRHYCFAMMPAARSSRTLRSRRTALASCEQFTAQRHAVQRDGDVVAAAGGVHFARGGYAASLLQQAFDEEEQIFLRAVKAASRIVRRSRPLSAAIRVCSSAAGENALPREHARVCVVDLDQRLQKICAWRLRSSAPKQFRRRSAREKRPVSLPSGILSQADQIRQDAIRARHARGQLAVERERIVNICAFAVARQQQAAALRILIRIVGLHERFILRVPGLHETHGRALPPIREKSASVMRFGQVNTGLSGFSSFTLECSSTTFCGLVPRLNG